ncbi:DUF6415 family natural product biosynthesis protein [Streptomyces syringium]|uniref:DUF6415 family natural product biosynthesis protein n=1 Tax=Streptomyces syringium TaxID=76729 RepID=UPI0034478771
MMTGETPPLDLVGIRATIRRALQERPVRARRAEIEELTGTLREQLELTLTHAQARADELNRGTLAWDRWQALIDQVRADLDHSDTAPCVAYLEVLARGARFLADCLDE